MWMPVNLSIKDVPDGLADALRTRARSNHRSLQGELMAMIETHTRAKPFRALELWQAARAAGLAMADDSTAMIRHDRDDPSR
jgi:plasmid stability protein